MVDQTKDRNQLDSSPLPPGQQLVAAGKWPIIGERTPAELPQESVLSISGLIERPQCLSLDELQQLPQSNPVIDIHCVTRWSKLGVSFSGVLLSELVRIACPQSDARFVSFVSHSQRRHSSSLPLEVALSQQALIAWAVDGNPLSIDHGGPLRNIVPGRYFYKSVKWLAEIEFLAEDRLGFWEAESGYHNTADPWLEQRYIAAQLDRREVVSLMESRDFSGRDLLSLSAADRDLAGLNANSSLLRNADFSRSNLRAANFTGANLSNANFQQADLQGACFAGADLEGANLAGANLRAVNFSGASLIGSSFFDPQRPSESAAQFDQQTTLGEAEMAPLFPLQFDFVRDQLRSLE